MSKKRISSHDIAANCEAPEIPNFKVASFDNKICTAAEFEENHKHDFFEIIWLKNGAGIHHIDLVEHSYDGSVFFVLAPGQIHKIDQKIISEGYVLKFQPGLFKNEKDVYDYLLDTCLFDSRTSCPVFNVPEKLSPVFDEIFLRMIDEFKHPEADTENILSAYVKILITHINRIKKYKLSDVQVPSNPQYALFKRFKIHIEHHYKTVHAVQAYAKMLNTQARTLNTVSRKFVNRSAGEMIQDRLILEAQRILYHEALSIKEICFELGFEDPAYFTRFFKKHTGLTPQQFKMQQL
ncbi:helix-turn-helix domain-containing protein [Fulvivirgaceae bacterium BMA12]|uniref:Helix-turn-helix domain-containing protein n=1 Tax=Agaribacillus aureus TaxID=3051825 RepID=A0ABT8LCC7_9BACT|nr:helix-turn-helix domain-containing protein [Fulvivirgaceae bacterium BMA12]